MQTSRQTNVAAGTISGFLPLDHARLYYEVTGSGPALALVHSRWMHSDLWDEQVKAFAGQYRVIRYDVRGYGRSDMELEPFTPYSDVDDLRRLLDHLGVDRAIVLGLSMGAGIALMFALEHPERVAALIMSGEGSWEYQGDMDEFNRAWERFEKTIQQGDYASAIDQVVEMWVGGPIRPARPEVIARTRELMRGHIFIHHRLSAPESQEEAPDTGEAPPSEQELLSAIRVPALIMVGEYDWPYIVESVPVLADHIPGAEHVVIPGAAHIANLEQPEAFNRAVLDFLSRRLPA